MSKFAFKRVNPENPADPTPPAGAVTAPVNTQVAPTPAAPPQEAPVVKPEVVQEVPKTAVQVANAAGKAEAPVTPVEVVHAAPAIAGPSALVAANPHGGAVTEYRAPASYGDDSDDIDASDIKLPRLNIVQKVGDLSNIFTEGDIVLSQESVIYKSPKTDKAAKPLRVIVVGFRKDRFTEKLAGGALGKLFDTEEQVVKYGGTLSYDENKATGKPYFQTLAEAIVLIEKPDDIEDSAFSYVADGKRYAVALWSMKGTQYTNAAKVFRTARKAGFLKDVFDFATNTIKEKRGYYFGIWELTTLLKPYGQNFSWIPVLKRAGETGPETRVLAQKVIE